jgi:cell division protein ZapA
MPTIRFSIGTQNFTLSCEEGEEDHIRQLAAHVNTRFETIQRTFGSAGNQLVMAVTMLMMQEDIQNLQSAQPATVASTTTPNSIDEEAIRQSIKEEVLVNVSRRLEKLAETLESV